MVKCVDIFTGEIVDVEYASRRYIPCSDYSVNTEPSMTVPDQVEPIEVTVRRCMRGELVNLGNKTPQYEFDDTVSFDDVSFDDLESPGADLADIPDLVSSVAGKAGEGTSAKADVGASTDAVASNKDVKPESETESKDSTESK